MVYRMDDFAFPNLKSIKADEASLHRLQDDDAGSVKVKNHRKVIREWLNMSIDPGAIVSFADNSIDNVDTVGSPSSLPLTIDVPPTMFNVVAQEVAALKTVVAHSTRPEYSMQAPFMVLTLALEFHIVYIVWVFSAALNITVHTFNCIYHMKS